VKVSIVIPSFNEGRRLPGTLDLIVRQALAKHKGFGHQFEIIVVEDGSTPSQVQLIEDCIVALKPINAEVLWQHLSYQPNQGKGAALDQGFRAAQGEWVGFLDADGSTSAQSVSDLIGLILAGTSKDALIGSRILMLGRIVHRNARRHYIGRVFATLFYLLFRVPAYDSQCGCKFFRRSLVVPLLDQILDRRWVWDTQLLVLCHQAGAEMQEVPVDWQESGGSHVSMLRDPLRMLLSLFKFRLLRARTKQS
jgi:dolichyl-phosphate beta-glucosyltransferase